LDLVLATVKLKAHPYPKNIFAGMYTYPRGSVETVCRRFANFVRNCKDPRTIAHAFVLRRRALLFYGPQDGVGISVFDGNGDGHARSEDGFKWAYTISTAIEMAGEMDFGELGDFSGEINECAMM
jgi:hypothetical protein